MVDGPQMKRKRGAAMRTLCERTSAVQREEVVTMGLLDRLFGRSKVAAPWPEKGPCLHLTLVPRWGSVADMGEEDRVTGYTCDGCHQCFIASEGHALRQTAAERAPAKVAI
jgi:hypothetical protein